MLLVAVVLVLSVRYVSSQGLWNSSIYEVDGEVGEVLNVTIQRGIPATLTYSVDTRNHTVQVG